MSQAEGGDRFEIVAAGGLCAPVSLSMTFETSREPVLSYPPLRGFKARFKDFWRWEPGWGFPLGYEVRPLMWYFPHVRVERGGITFNKGGW